MSVCVHLLYVSQGLTHYVIQIHVYTFSNDIVVTACVATCTPGLENSQLARCCKVKRSTLNIAVQLQLLVRARALEFTGLQTIPKASERLLLDILLSS